MKASHSEITHTAGQAGAQGRASQQVLTAALGCRAGPERRGGDTATNLSCASCLCSNPFFTETQVSCCGKRGATHPFICSSSHHWLHLLSLLAAITPYVCVYMCVSVCMHVYMCMCVSMCVRVCMSVCACTQVPRVHRVR